MGGYEPGDSENQQKFPRTRRASEVTPRPVEWLWQDRIPRGKLTLLDGDPGLGKTTLLLDLSARVSTGRSMPGESNGHGREPEGVLYLSAEDDDGDTIRPRLEAAGANLDRVHLWAEAILPALPGDVEKIAQLVIAFDVGLIVLDPVGPFLDVGINVNRDADVRQALAPLRGICELTGTSAVLLRHLNKDGRSSNALYRGGGSIAFIAAARSALLVAKDPNDDEQLILAHTKSNVGRLAGSLAYRLDPVPVANAGEQVRIEWLGAADYAAADLLAVKRQGRSEKREGRSEKRENCAAWLREKLAGENMVARKTLVAEAERNGWQEHLVKRAATAIGVVSQRENRVHGGTLWSLK